jgi:hypothetical protein
MTHISIRLTTALFTFFPVVASIAGLFVSFSGFSQQIVLDGLYTGNNIYIQSPGDADEYCVTAVVVNGITVNDLAKQAAFEVPLDRQFLTIGDSVHIVIHHQDGCKPKVLNTTGCVFSRKESISHFSATNGLLSWEFQHPPAGYKWIVQQYRWNQWDSIGTVVTDAASTHYSFQAPSLHSGDNLFRLIGFSTTIENGLSEELHVSGGNAAVEMNFHKKKHYVVFSSPTFYRVMDGKGQVIKEDSTQSFGVDKLPKGVYFVLFDNHSERIRL